VICECTWQRYVLRAGPCILARTLCCLLLAVTGAHAVNTAPSEILTIPHRFDSQVVTLSGTIANLRERVSQRGNPYYTFNLSDGKQAVRVFSFGKAPCRSGSATVGGTFEKVKRPGRYTFYDEVTATRVTCRTSHR
jgi:hypothetical protein